MKTMVRSTLVAIALCAGIAGEARAQGYISPLLGFNFGGDANCPDITGCEAKRLNVGVALGVTGNVFGFEEEFAYAKDFFGSVAGLESSVLTLTSNLLIIPKVGPIRPYGLIGAGLIKSHIELTPNSLLTATNNKFGWTIGGGVMVTVAPHIALRGDLRYFHSFSDATFLGIPLDGETLDFGRASGALVVRF
jgi:opacity protein-like surface antigen